MWFLQGCHVSLQLVYNSFANANMDTVAEDSPEYIMQQAVREYIPEIPLSSSDEECGKGMKFPSRTVRRLGWSPVYPSEQSTQQDALGVCYEVLREEWNKKPWQFSSRKYWN
jgi:hypothetical protein